MELTTAMVERVLRRLGLPPGDESPFDLLDASRHERHQVAMTLVCLWEREGRFVSPALRYELRLHRDLQASLAELRDELAGRVPGVGFVKGLEVASLYPSGVLREMKDLDVLVPERGDVWDVAALLIGRGWSVRAFTLLEVAGRLHVVVGVRRPAQDPQVMFPQVVEIATVAFPGTRGVAWSEFAERHDPALKNLLALLNERVEDRVWRRTLRARDVLDAAMLLEALGLQGLGVEAGKGVVEGGDGVVEAVRRHGFVREWVELTGFMAEVGLASEELAAGARTGAGRARIAALKRGLPGMGLTAAAAGWVQRGMAAERRSAGRDRVARLLDRRASPRRVLAAGLPLFGLRVDPEPAAEDLEVLERDRAAVARTPIGTFALSFTDSAERARRLAAALPASGGEAASREA